MRYCLSEPGEAAAGAELACDLWWYWLTHGHRTEGRRVLAALLDQLDQAAAVRLRVLWVAGYVAQYQGDIPGARAGWRPRCPPPARSAMSGRRRTHRGFLGWDLYFLGDPGQGYALAQTGLVAPPAVG